MADGAKNLFQQANTAYEEENYDSTISLLDSLLSVGLESSELYYNMGNTWFKKNGWQTPNNEDKVYQLLKDGKPNKFVSWIRKIDKEISRELALKTWQCLEQHKEISDHVLGNKATALIEANLLAEEEIGIYITVTKTRIRW